MPARKTAAKKPPATPETDPLLEPAVDPAAALFDRVKEEKYAEFVQDLKAVREEIDFHVANAKEQVKQAAAAEAKLQVEGHATAWMVIDVDPVSRTKTLAFEIHMGKGFLIRVDLLAEDGSIAQVGTPYFAPVSSITHFGVPHGGLK